jgi:hypothetical protein
MVVTPVIGVPVHRTTIHYVFTAAPVAADMHISPVRGAYAGSVKNLDGFQVVRSS